jgi:hypothetical protein
MTPDEPHRFRDALSAVTLVVAAMLFVTAAASLFADSRLPDTLRKAVALHAPQQ